MHDQELGGTDNYFHEDMATFGDRLAAARENLGLEQAQLARKLGVKASTIANWEDDRSEPRANRATTLAGLLGVSIKWLLSGQGDGPSIVTDEDSDTADALALMAEMRRIRGQQARLADQLGVVEKRLRAILG